jgi:hypothetical protein
VAEVRQPLGVDARLGDKGVLLYTVDARVASLHGPVKVVGAFGTPSERTSVYEDASIKLDVLATDGKSYRVLFTRK